MKGGTISAHGFELNALLNTLLYPGIPEGVVGAER